MHGSTREYVRPASADKYAERSALMNPKERALVQEYKQRKKSLDAEWQSKKCVRNQDEAFVVFVKCILSSRTNWSKVVSVVDGLAKNRILFTGNASQLLDEVRGIGGMVDHRARANWIVEDRQMFPLVFWLTDSIRKGSISLGAGGLSEKEILAQGDVQAWSALIQNRGLTREALRAVVKVLRGAGDKQASHFLLSLGFEGYAVIDTYILDKLVEFHMISSKPRNLASSRYLSLEQMMQQWSSSIGIPLHIVDMLWWRNRHS
jgi:thermostable 8-oxoguanine DNA glycosylase